MTADNKSDHAPAVVEGHGAVFAVLRQLLVPYENELVVRIDKPGHCYLETRSASLNGRRLFFAAAKVKKRYVSFYLTALHMFPDLLRRVSPSLRESMQGQSCFNFTSIDQDCSDELGRLAEAGFERFKSQALL